MLSAKETLEDLRNMNQVQKAVLVTHQYSASAEDVYNAFLNPAIAMKFLFATPNGQMIVARTDARVGGSFLFTDRRDG